MRALILSILDILVPPRASERLLRTLTLEQLLALGGEDGLPYHDPRITALIWEIKYYSNRRAATLAGAYLGEIVLAAAAEEIGLPLFIPVPMHKARRRERGHNQTELLCKATLSALRSSQSEVGLLEYAPHALVRVLHTKTQQGLPKAERLHNVKNCMVASPRVAGRACIVLDDVATTGATMEEAKRALHHAGARAVHTIALARS